MTDAAIISGSLVDVRNVGTHKSVKLTIHVPEEYAMKVVAAFGWPTGVNPISVAIARLKPESEVMPSDAETSSTVETRPRPVSRSSAGADKCIAVHMGGTHCVGRCIEPRNCSGSPLPADKERRAFSDMPPAQQAGILCNERAFLKFMSEKFPDHVRNCGSTAAAVRELCKVDSRADIKFDNAEWSALVLAYRLWKNHPELEDA